MRYAEDYERGFRHGLLSVARRPLRRLIVGWLWPEIVYKLTEPEYKSAERLVEMGLLRDRSADSNQEHDPASEPKS